MLHIHTFVFCGYDSHMIIFSLWPSGKLLLLITSDQGNKNGTKLKCQGTFMGFRAQIVPSCA